MRTGKLPLLCSRFPFSHLTFVSCPDIIKGRYRQVNRPWVALLGSVYVSWYALPIFLLRDITHAVDDIFGIKAPSTHPLDESCDQSLCASIHFYVQVEYINSPGCFGWGLTCLWHPARQTRRGGYIFGLSLSSRGA